MAPSDPSDTVLEVCLRVRQSGALRVLVALVRIILDLWAAPPQCGYWGSMGFFCSAPQDFGLLGVSCARFPPREARYSVSHQHHRVSSSFDLEKCFLKPHSSKTQIALVTRPGGSRRRWTEAPRQAQQQIRPIDQRGTRHSIQ